MADLAHTHKDVALAEDVNASFGDGANNKKRSGAGWCGERAFMQSNCFSFVSRSVAPVRGLTR
jgi:hypothetical protein